MLYRRDCANLELKAILNARGPATLPSALAG
jgi:hypothetical protein